MRVEELKPPKPLVSSHSFVSAVSKSEQVSLSKAIMDSTPLRSAHHNPERCGRDGHKSKESCTQKSTINFRRRKSATRQADAPVVWRKNERAAKGDAARPNFFSNARFLEHHVIVRTDRALIRACAPRFMQRKNTLVGPIMPVFHTREDILGQLELMRYGDRLHRFVYAIA